MSGLIGLRELARRRISNGKRVQRRWISSVRQLHCLLGEFYCFFIIPFKAVGAGGQCVCSLIHSEDIVWLQLESLSPVNECVLHVSLRVVQYDSQIAMCFSELGIDFQCLLKARLASSSLLADNKAIPRLFCA